MPLPSSATYLGRVFSAFAALSLLVIVSSCKRADTPQVAFARAQQTFIRGNLSQSQRAAAAGYQAYHASAPEWADRFRMLEVESLLWAGRYDEAKAKLKTLTRSPGVTISALTAEGVIETKVHDFTAANTALHKADELCRLSDDPACGAVLRAHGVLEDERGQLEKARQFFAQSLSFARAHNDKFLECTALLNLGFAQLREEHFSEAADWSQDAYQGSAALDATYVAETALGNLGWAYYSLGDSERALDLFVEAEKKSVELGSDTARVSWLTNIGYVQMDAAKYELAEQSYQRALELAKRINARQDTFNGLRAMAKVSVQSGKLEQAQQFAKEAIVIARESGDRTGELYPILVMGQVAARRGDAGVAEKNFSEVEQDPKATAALIWGAQHALAQLHEEQGKKDDAEREYRAALATFEKARSALTRDDARLPFVTNAARIYDDYVIFLLNQGRVDEALDVADYSRARTLAEGLHRLRKGSSFAPEALNARAVARKAGGTLLFYWLGEKQSYLWTVTPQKTSVVRLAPAAEINAAVQQYRKTLLGPLDALEGGNGSGAQLYRMLIEPAAATLPKDSKVYVIPDGLLNSLNFETLVAPGDKPHYWIEDVTVVNASSLRMLASASPSGKASSEKLLLLGDPTRADPSYPELSNAASEIDAVRKYFPDSAEAVFAHERATPTAYLNSAPEKFAFIHFVAHGTASRLSPLDSAVVLAKATAEQDSFKLYARDILKRPLHAELVTISTCYGAGSRAYTGEGLVGLSWAFLRAGAHNVIGALWEVSDVSTPGLMEQMYGDLKKGRTPDRALRDAKLAMLRSGGDYRRPFYWAPFQLYTGS